MHNAADLQMETSQISTKNRINYDVSILYSNEN